MHHVLSKELLKFLEDSIELSSFMLRFVQSIKKFVFSNEKNLDWVFRSLKNKALSAVKSYLYREDASSSELSTLKMLFGQPEIVYDSLIENIIMGSEVKSESI